MTIIIAILFIFINAVLTFFTVYHFSFFLLYLVYSSFFSSRKVDPIFHYHHRFCIIVPAHNEAKIINRLIDSLDLLQYPKNKYEVLIIADNCTDDTAQIAIDRGINCLIRNDLTRIGKPYALNWALKQLRIGDFDAFTIIDADTAIHPDYLSHMDLKLLKGDHAIQGYFDIMNPGDTWFTHLMVIPGVLKFHTRYFIKDKIGLSCPLMGNGMTFSRSVIEGFGWNAFSITENWEYYVQLLLKGYNVGFSSDAKIFSHAVSKLSHGETQRKRWIRGRLGVFKNYLVPILFEAKKNRSLILYDALFELASLSYSMLFSFTILTFIIAFILHNYIIIPAAIYFWCTAVLLLQLIFFFSGLFISKSPLKVWLKLPYLPVFLLWKVYISVKSLFNFKKLTWEKTDRKSVT